MGYTSLFISLIRGITGINKKNSKIRKLREISISNYKHFYKLGQWNEALNELNRYSSTYGKDGELYFFEAITWEKLEQHNKFVESIEEAIKYDSTNYIYHYKYGEVHIKRNNTEMAIEQFEKAIKQYNKALSHSIKKAAIHNKLGLCYKKLYNYKEAEKHFRKAVNSTGKNEENETYKENLENIFKYQGL